MCWDLIFFIIDIRSNISNKKTNIKFNVINDMKLNGKTKNNEKIVGCKHK